MVLDKDFWIVVWSLSLVTWMIPAFCIGGIDKWWRVVIAYVLGIVISFALVYTIQGQHQGDLKRYNNGVCTECQGTLEFVTASKSRWGDTTYYYQCDQCGRILEFDTKVQY